MTGMWLVFAVSSDLLIGALATGWELLRCAASPRLLVPKRSTLALVFVNHAMIAPALSVVLARIGATAHFGALGGVPPLARVAVSFVAFEAVTYALHRLAHRVPSLFRIHRVHHEAGELCWIDAFRQHPLEFASFQAIGNLPAVILFGASAQVSLWLNVVLRLWTAWLHARGPMSFGPLELVLTSPAMHHAHHEKRVAGDVETTTCNYGGLLSVFDWLGGTGRCPARASAETERAEPEQRIIAEYDQDESR